MYLTNDEQVFSDEYLKQGYIIRPAFDLEALEWISKQFINLIENELDVQSSGNPQDVLNNIHQNVPVSELNEFRLKIIQGFNAIEGFREMYFRVARPYLETIVGNELSMQLRVNLSIQLPGDSSSLLPVHADTWSGDSSFEVVVWLPLVNCYDTKSMYILPPRPASKLSGEFIERAGNNSDDLYDSIVNDVEWLEVRYGEVLIFNQALPHGNSINEESETRWSMNCRFKSVFSPYGDKKIGEFFEPITLRPASINGMNYHFPKIK
jgi:sporadic carbohydrate cluster 2OG-Fe(II) oxygenase